MQNRPHEIRPETHEQDSTENRIEGEDTDIGKDQERGAVKIAL